MKKIFRKKMKRLIPVYAVLTTFALLIAASCASSENGSGDEPVIPSANTSLKKETWRGRTEKEPEREE